MFLGRLRKSLAKRAHGDVLEVSVGTGRNTKYYDIRKCKRITMVDQSGEMVKIATEKFRELYPQYKQCSFLAQPAEDPMPSPPPSGYDTIIQTMGLCSTPKPSALLQRLGTLANQKHGQILLLEHGRSHYSWLNAILDDLAAHHADRYGCWWNRDIGKIVEESGLEVQKIKRYHLGTTWWIELRPKGKVKGERSHGEKGTKREVGHDGATYLSTSSQSGGIPNKHRVIGIGNLKVSLEFTKAKSGKNDEDSNGIVLAFSSQ
ncbi:MAG: hypothetical protein M1830_006349, partial [Pleopsidium flavum]